MRIKLSQSYCTELLFVVVNNFATIENLVQQNPQIVNDQLENQQDHNYQEIWKLSRLVKPSEWNTMLKQSSYLKTLHQYQHRQMVNHPEIVDSYWQISFPDWIKQPKDENKDDQPPEYSKKDY